MLEGALLLRHVVPLVLLQQRCAVAHVEAGRDSGGDARHRPLLVRSDQAFVLVNADNDLRPYV